MFPESRTIKFANPLFEKCIVENEEDCMKDATKLISEIDDILKRIKLDAEQTELVKKMKSIGEIPEKILFIIANLGNQGYEARQLAGRVELSVTKTEYYLERMFHDGLLDRADYTDRESDYFLSQAGRAYLVENNLI